MLISQLHPGVVPGRDGIKQDRGEDRGRVYQGLARQQVAKCLVLWNDKAGNGREVERDHERDDIGTEEYQEQTPVRHPEEEQHRSG